MSARRRLAILAVACSAACFVTGLTSAQDAAPAGIAEVENSKFQFEGRINASAVYIRSGASDNDYPTMKLDRDARVTVVGMKFDWLKIVPPADSFCYVAKAYVEKRGDGTLGRVTQPINVRVGSGLNALKTKVATKLDPGADVQIIGEQDEYFKIAPPSGVFVYVNKQFVDPVRPIGAEPALAENTGPAMPETNDTTTDVTADTTGAGASAAQTTEGNPPQDPAVGILDPAAQNVIDPTITPADNALAAAPTTQPGAAGIAQADLNKTTFTPEQAEQEYDRLEAELAEANRLPLDQQPLQQLQAGYTKVVAAAALPSSLQKRAESQLALLKQRVEDQDQFAAVLKKQEEARQQQLALQAERKEIEDRIAKTQVQVFAAVGTLRVSSLQPGKETLYRLTDPQSGRTLVYVRSNDQQLAELVGQFIGVKGPISDDPQLQLKIVTPAGAQLVDPSKVNTKVLAQITPPSLMPQSQAVSTME